MLLRICCESLSTERMELRVSHPASLTQWTWILVIIISISLPPLASASPNGCDPNPCDLKLPCIAQGSRFTCVCPVDSSNANCVANTTNTTTSASALWLDCGASRVLLRLSAELLAAWAPRAVGGPAAAAPRGPPRSANPSCAARRERLVTGTGSALSFRYDASRMCDAEIRDNGTHLWYVNKVVVGGDDGGDFSITYSCPYPRRPTAQAAYPIVIPASNTNTLILANTTVHLRVSPQDATLSVRLHLSWASGDNETSSSFSSSSSSPSSSSSSPVLLVRDCWLGSLNISWANIYLVRHGCASHPAASLAAEPNGRGPTVELRVETDPLRWRSWPLPPAPLLLRCLVRVCRTEASRPACAADCPDSSVHGIVVQSEGAHDGILMYPPPSASTSDGGLIIPGISNSRVRDSVRSEATAQNRTQNPTDISKETDKRPLNGFPDPNLTEILKDTDKRSLNAIPDLNPIEISKTDKRPLNAIPDPNLTEISETDKHSLNAIPDPNLTEISERNKRPLNAIPDPNLTEISKETDKRSRNGFPEPSPPAPNHLVGMSLSSEAFEAGIPDSNPMRVAEGRGKRQDGDTIIPESGRSEELEPPTVTPDQRDDENVIPESSPNPAVISEGAESAYGTEGRTEEFGSPEFLRPNPTATSDASGNSPDVAVVVWDDDDGDDDGGNSEAATDFPPVDGGVPGTPGRDGGDAAGDAEVTTQEEERRSSYGPDTGGMVAQVYTGDGGGILYEIFFFFITASLTDGDDGDGDGDGGDGGDDGAGGDAGGVDGDDGSGLDAGLVPLESEADALTGGPPSAQEGTRRFGHKLKSGLLSVVRGADSAQQQQRHDDLGGGGCEPACPDPQLCEPGPRGSRCICPHGLRKPHCTEADLRVQCGPDHIRVSLPVAYLAWHGVSPGEVSLGGSDCPGSVEKAGASLAFYIEHGRHGSCGSRLEQTATHVTLWNELRAGHSTRHIDRTVFALRFNCSYATDALVHLPFPVTPTLTVVDYGGQRGSFRVSMSLHNASTFTAAGSYGASPTLATGDVLFVRLALDVVPGRRGHRIDEEEEVEEEEEVVEEVEVRNRSDYGVRLLHGRPPGDHDDDEMVASGGDHEEVVASGEEEEALASGGDVEAVVVASDGDMEEVEVSDGDEEEEALASGGDHEEVEEVEVVTSGDEEEEEEVEEAVVVASDGEEEEAVVVNSDGDDVEEVEVVTSDGDVEVEEEAVVVETSGGEEEVAVASDNGGEVGDGVTTSRKRRRRKTNEVEEEEVEEDDDDDEVDEGGHWEVGERAGGWDLRLAARGCWATPTPNVLDNVSHSFITHGCPSDRTLRFLSANGNSTHVLFRLRVFRFLPPALRILYLHCRVRVCAAASAGCEQSCAPAGRGDTRRRRRRRRSAPDFEGVVSFGPIVRRPPPPPSSVTVLLKSRHGAHGALWFSLLGLSSLGVVGALVAVVRSAAICSSHGRPREEEDDLSCRRSVT
ncbi:uncharacterized protein LOC144738829 [Lampetra planeri]